MNWELHLQLFLILGKGEWCINGLAATCIGGKVEVSTFPPLRVEEIPHLQLFRRLERR